ncbi:carboxymuconolactone decarboxylase family protein [Actinokineospora auranticolor]|uniref:AhpD family alkylhydroperoxidase n=1 Tax=Actinokineospora auranticolor TaxID=155976 RepID=A0A2S6GIJ0_9PSEU|nr:carboxymuconolactone decarboxylase family protein [Actinokineospora auranticolor]PPK65003.1 AhpD family alkylhydroperoxidase [Actinokineospora auranticolor]
MALEPPKSRLRVDKLVPHVMAAMESLEDAGDKLSLPLDLLELVRVRVSQVNNCAFCVHAHHQAALDAGVSATKLAALPVWREAPFYDDRERAALEVGEALTNVNVESVGDDVWARAGEHFTEVELAELTWAVAIINVWNRIAGGARPWPVS